VGQSACRVSQNEAVGEGAQARRCVRAHFWDAHMPSVTRPAGRFESIVARCGRGRPTLGLCDQTPGRYRRRATAVLSLVSERTVASHLGSLSLPKRASSARWSRTRRQATGESITRFAQSLMPWASRSMTLSTIFTAMAPFAAARRSSYAARLQRSEHHVAGRPVGRWDGVGPPHRGHLRSSTPAV